MSTHKNHPYHLVDVSTWPILGALSAMITMNGINTMNELMWEA